MSSQSPQTVLDLIGDGLFQLSYITDDFERGLRELKATVGGSAFMTLDQSHFEDLVFRGEPMGRSAMTAAIAMIGHKTVELVQRTTTGPYSDASRGSGLLELHHVGVRVDDLATCRDTAATAGLDATFTGRYLDTQFFYADCRELLGHWVEFIQFGPESARLIDEPRPAPRDLRA